MRVLVFGAGGPAGINVVRSLAEAGHEVVGVDADPAHLPWADVYCTETYVGVTSELGELVKRLGIDAIHSQVEQGVQWIADHKDHLDCATLCPDSRVIALTQDKWEACLAFRRSGLRGDRVHLVQDRFTLQDAADDLGYPFWLRARHGAGARGSCLARGFSEAFHWLYYWLSRDTSIDFTAEAYLPGRDLAWSSLWYEGQLIVSFGRERLEYIYPKLAPSGRTGTPTIARTVHDDVLNAMAIDTVMSIDPAPHGFYSVDLREDAQGVPRPTEVNAGRCFTTSYLATAAGVNFMDIWCALIEGTTAPILIPGRVNSIPANLTWMRHIDCPELLLDEHGQIFLASFVASASPFEAPALEDSEVGLMGKRTYYPPEYMR